MLLTISNLTSMSSYHKARTVVPKDALLFIFIKKLNMIHSRLSIIMRHKKGWLKTIIIVANLYKPPKDATDKYKYSYMKLHQS